MDKYATAKWATNEAALGDSLTKDNHKKHTHHDEVEMRAVVQYIMMDEEFFQMNKKDWKVALKRLVQAMEAIAWLHNCQMLQS